MKILLINTPWINNETEYSIKSGTRWAALRKRDRTMPYFPFPYFLASAATYLKKHGLKAHVKDAVAEELSTEATLAFVQNLKPDLMLVEAFTPSIEADLEFCRKAKKATGCTTVLCGAHVTAVPEETLLKEGADFVIQGEYELPLRQLAETLSRGEQHFESIKGLAFRQGDKCFIHPERQCITDLDEVPFPERDELPVYKYNEPLAKFVPNARVTTTRGCPYHCIFCVEPLVNGRQYRKRSVKSVMEEIRMLQKKYGVREILFDDTLFTIPRAKEIANAMIDEGIRLESWSCWMDWNIGLEDILLLKKSGCTALKFGIETANGNVNRAIGKPEFLGKIAKLISNLKSNGITVHASFMFGLPGETKQNLQETMDLAFSLGLNSCQFSIATPLPGTPFFQEASEKGWLASRDWSEFEPLEHCVVDYPECRKNDILEAMQEVRKRKVRQFFKSPGLALIYLWKLMKLQGPKVFFRELFKKILFTLKSFLG